MVRKICKNLGLTLLFYGVICFSTPFVKIFKERSIENQIRHLSDIMDNGYDDVLQARFPEGKLFSNALLALSVIEYSEYHRVSSTKYASIVDECVKRIQSEKAKKNFNEELIPEYGMFYCGWSNLVYDQYQKSDLFDYSKIQTQVQVASDRIEQRIIKTQSDSLRILNSYHSSAWPADNLIGICSMSDAKLQHDWIQRLLEISNHTSGLINHTGHTSEEIRGSSSAMITYCLGKSGYRDIDNYNAEFQRLLN